MALSKLVQLCIAILFSAVFGGLALIGLVINFLKGPRTFFKVKDRKRPDVLVDGWNHDFVTLNNGLRFHYVHEGDRSKPLMLLLHGFPEFWFSWRHQIKEFAKTYYVVAMDMRGYGESDKPEGVNEYAVNLLVNDVREFVAAIGFNTCTLVAHDWGGVIAYQVLLQYPELVDKGVVLNCPHPSAFRKYLYSTPRQMLKSWYMFFFQLPYVPELFLRAHDFELFDQMFGTQRKQEQWLNDEPFSEVEMDALKWTFSQKGALTAPINYYRSAFTRSGTQHVRERGSNSRVAVPLMIVWGTADLALSTELADLSAQYCENAEVTYIEGASHFVHEDMPENVNRAMWRYLKGKE